MEESGATYLCDLVKPASPGGGCAPAASALPMYLVVISGGIPGAMIRLVARRDPAGPGGRQHGAIARRQHLPLPRLPRRPTRRAWSGSTTWAAPTAPSSTADACPRTRRSASPTATASSSAPSVVVKFIRPDPCEEQFQREMFERTVRDPLTSLYNRAYFLAQFGPLADRSGLKGLGMAVLMLDIDHFKRVNDDHGHDVGDAGAPRGRRRAPPGDPVGRPGGPLRRRGVRRRPAGGRARPGHRTRRADPLEPVRPADPGRRRAAPGDRQHRPGLHPAGPPPVGRLADLATADQGLYQAKNSGRDRIVFSHELVPRSIESVTTVDD